MEYSSLSTLIRQLEYGTKLHIGVLFFGRYGHPLLSLPAEQTIHTSVLCTAFKADTRHGFPRCFRCRNLAIRKAIREQRAFGGLCINGIYEYTHPVVDNRTVIAIIFVGNIATEATEQKLRNRPDLLTTLQRDFPEQRCRDVCAVLESYICLIRETHPVSAPDSSTVIGNVQAYLVANARYGITVSQVARVFNYNPKYLGRLFFRETGQTVTQFLNTERIKQAKKLLANETLPLSAVAERVGFSDPAYFSTVFKSLCSMTPGMYRELACRSAEKTTAALTD